MSKASELIARVVPPGLKTTDEERDIVLEIAYLTIAADHKLTDEELEAFGNVTAKIYGSPQDIDAILERFADWRDRDEIIERLRTLGAKLGPAARSLAYRVAYGLAMCDLETSDEEFEFDLQLIDALELTDDQAAQLADEVQKVFQG